MRRGRAAQGGTEVVRVSSGMDGQSRWVGTGTEST